MRIVAGRVVNGHIQVDESDLPEGAAVVVAIRDEDRDGWIVSAEDEDELVAALDEADRGELVDEDEFRRVLHSRIADR